MPKATRIAAWDYFWTENTRLFPHDETAADGLKHDYVDELYHSRLTVSQIETIANLVSAAFDEGFTRGRNDDPALSIHSADGSNLASSVCNATAAGAAMQQK